MSTYTEPVLRSRSKTTRVIPSLTRKPTTSRWEKIKKNYERAKGIIDAFGTLQKLVTAPGIVVYTIWSFRENFSLLDIILVLS